ncbi:hypothetical protein BB560_003642 [Smittium megazygosporum]|uniref:Synembryn-A n=1 Tax=Smittium megazygosporum TaxID=133381 RepID=A0A2T9ZBG3_9FUNG|nr:hypothetical protein BB560_003642 [Smittium megazygosporum]
MVENFQPLLEDCLQAFNSGDSGLLNSSAFSLKNIIFSENTDVKTLLEISSFIYTRILSKSAKNNLKYIDTVLDVVKEIERKKIALSFEFLSSSTKTLIEILPLAFIPEKDAHSLKSNIPLNSSLANNILTTLSNRLFFYSVNTVKSIENADGYEQLKKPFMTDTVDTDTVFLFSRVVFLSVYNGVDPKRLAFDLGFLDLLANNTVKLLDGSTSISGASPARFPVYTSLVESLKATYILCTKFEDIRNNSHIKPNNTLLELFGNTIEDSLLYRFTRVLESTLYCLSKFSEKSKVSAETTQDVKKVLDHLLQILFLFPVPFLHEDKDFSIESINERWNLADKNNESLSILLSLLQIYIAPLESLDKTTTQVLNVQEHTTLFILVCLLARFSIYCEPIRLHVKEFIFGDRDFNMLPESGKSLRATITKLVSLPYKSDLTLCFGDFIYVLFDSNPGHVIKQLGFGNTIGYFSSRSSLLQINMNEILSQDPKSQAQPGKSALESSKDFNVVTGSSSLTAGNEDEPSLEDMTDEQKELEAERLFVLFEKLEKTGIVKIEPQFGNLKKDSQ